MEVSSWIGKYARMCVDDRALGTVLTGSRYHPLIYTEAGKQTTERLWVETMEELRFAGVAGVLRSVA